MQKLNQFGGVVVQQKEHQSSPQFSRPLVNNARKSVDPVSRGILTPPVSSTNALFLFNTPKSILLAVMVQQKTLPKVLQIQGVEGVRSMIPVLPGGDYWPPVQPRLRGLGHG